MEDGCTLSGHLVIVRPTGSSDIGVKLYSAGVEYCDMVVTGSYWSAGLAQSPSHFYMRKVWVDLFGEVSNVLLKSIPVKIIS